MNRTSEAFPLGVSEFEIAGLELLPSVLVSPPRVKCSPVQMECRFLQTIEMPSGTTDRNYVTFGRVIGVHIDDDLIVDGKVEICRAKPIARMGYMDYTCIESVFEMVAPSRQGKAFAALREPDMLEPATQSLAAPAK